MARMKSGPFGPFIGKMGGLVGYMRRGQQVTRAVPHPTTAPPSLKQLISRKQFSMAQQFVSPIKDFINYSFHPETKGTTRIPQNAANSYFRKLAIQGEYPDYQIDFSKVMVSKGDLTAPANASVSLSGNLLTFKWATPPAGSSTRNEDQVMLLAYLPDSKSAAFIVGGPGRSAGEAVLKFLPKLGNAYGSGKDTAAETYIAFISNDRQQVSDSVYLGRLEL